VPDLSRLYLDTVKSLILNDVYPEAEAERVYLIKCVEGAEQFDARAFYSSAVCDTGMMGAIDAAHAKGRHHEGRLKFATIGASMVGRARLENVEACLNTVLAERVPGGFVECGVWRGGACAFAKAVLDARGSDRRVWLADSFEGLAEPEHAADTIDLSARKYPMLAVSRPRVQALFERLGLMDERGCFLEGWFSKTLPQAPIGRIAVLRLDGDYYESTMTPLRALYDRVSPGGFVIVDDYGLLEPARRAVDEFRAAQGICAPLMDIDGHGYFWRNSC
jgi:O-methyltransferase